MRDSLKIGPYVVSINMSDEETAAGIGEYVADGLDARALTPDEACTAARQAFHAAIRVRHYTTVLAPRGQSPRWPAFGEDWIR